MADVDRVQLPQQSSNADEAVIENGQRGSADGQGANSTTNNHSSNAGSQQRPSILTGTLPDHFLRLGTTENMQPFPQQQVFATTPHAFMPRYYQKGGILTVTIAQARLAKNYGLTRMDPYCRLRVGNAIFETPTAMNGSKNPRWNKLFQIPLPDGVNRMYIEVFDECSFSPDERIAWGLILIKDEVLTGEIVDDWYSLSGKQGDDKEGMINIILEYRESPIPAAAPAPMFMQPVPMAMAYGTQMAYAYPQGYVQPFTGVPVAMQQPTQQLPQQPQTIRDEDVKKIKDMFPDMDEEIIRSVLLSSDGNVDTAVNHLLTMTAS